MHCCRVLVGFFCCMSDIDECADKSTNKCDLTTTTCVNNEGSYSCSCKPGYYAKAGQLNCTGIATQMCYGFKLLISGRLKTQDLKCKT